MNKYECEFCDSKFKLNVELRIHIRNDHSQNTQQKTTKFTNRISEKPTDHLPKAPSPSTTSTTTKVPNGPTSQEKKFKLSLNSVTPVFGDGLSSTNDNSNLSSRDDSSSVTSSSIRKAASIKSQSSSSSRSSNNNGRRWNYQRRTNQVYEDDSEDDDDDYRNENSDNEQEEEEDDEETKKETRNTANNKSTTKTSCENDKKQNRKSAPQKRTSTNDNGSDHSEGSNNDDNGLNVESGDQLSVQNIYIQQRTTCIYCNRVLSNIKNLVLHNRKYHANETTTTFIQPTHFPHERPRMFSCVKCTKKYESNNLLWKHRINSCGLASKYKCKYCFKQYKLLCQSLDCAKSHTRAQVTKFKEEQELERQRKQKQKVNVEKVEGDSSLHLFSNSTSNQQQKSSSSSSAQHTCYYKSCYKTFTDRFQLSEHGLLAHAILMCIYCDSILLSQSKLDEHYTDRHSKESIVVNDQCNSGAFSGSHKNKTQENKNHREEEDNIAHTKTRSSTPSSITESIDSDKTASILTHSTTKIKEEKMDIEEPTRTIPIVKREEEPMQVEEENFNCKVCGKNCMNTFALEIHSRKHQPSTFKCAVCSEKFVSMELLENHCKQQHSLKTQKEPSKSMNCVQCGEIFTKLREYLRHKKEHQNPGKISSASTEETDTDGNGKVDAEDTDSSSMDNFPTTNGESKRSSRIRRQRSPEIDIKCELCQTEFHRQSHYDYHLTKELCKEKEENKYKCSTCGQSFRRLTTLENHKKSHSEPKETNEAEEDSFINYSRSRPTKEQQLGKSDESRFKKPVHLNHRKRHQESPYTASSASDDESLPPQNKKIARIQPQSSKIANKQDGDYFAQTTDHRCVECSSRFSTSQELALHLLEHNRVKMRQAEIAKFEQEAEEEPTQSQQQQPPPTKFLRASRKIGVTLYKCVVCGLQRFKSREDMIDHVKARHQKIGEYGCPFSNSCKKLCKTALELCDHVVFHEKQAEIDGKGDLLVEENTRSRSRSTTKSNNNVQPRLQEEPKRPGPQSSRTKMITKPIQSSSKKTSTSSNNRSRVQQTSPNPGKFKNIPCPVCKRAMDSRVQLKAHILASHMDRSFKFCPKPTCAVLFHDQSGLKRHISEGNCVI